jgi:DNA gyrase inhibitor GyrI
VSNVEQPKYTVVESDGNFEIRDYEPMIVAAMDVTGTRESAIREGFRTIADYIFGYNLASQNIAMTAPVMQQGDVHTWQVRFVMPAGYTMETLPLPKNTAVKLKPIQRQRFAAVRFSGSADPEGLETRADQLRAFIKEKRLNFASEPIYAFYDPPWTLPFLRRNEVLFEISS